MQASIVINFYFLKKKIGVGPPQGGVATPPPDILGSLQYYHMRCLNLCNRPQGIHFCNRNWILTYRLTANQVDRPNIAEIKGGVQIHSFCYHYQSLLCVINCVI